MRRSYGSPLALLFAGLAALPAMARAGCPPLLQVAAYDVALVDRALEDQARVVLQAAQAHAQRNGGRYPARVDDFATRLPRQGRMANVWTGEATVPSDTSTQTAGEIEYRVIHVHGQPVGCSVVATGRFGARIVLVSDPQGRGDSQPALELSSR